MDISGPDGSSNLLDFLLSRIQSHGERVAQVESWSGRKRTYSEIWRWTLENGRRLRLAGIGPGSVVALCLQNVLEYAEILLGVLQAGAMAALFPPLSTRRELEHLVSLAQPSLVIVSELNDDLAAVLENRPGVSVLTVHQIEMREDGSGGPVPLCPAKLSSPAVLLASSGSTGLPKGVVIRHSNLIWSLSACSDLFMEQEKSALGLMPFYHAYGLGLMLMALFKGSPLVIMNKFSLTEFTSTLIKHKIHHVHVVPSLVVKMASDEIPADKLKYIRAVYSGAGAISSKIQAALLGKLDPEARLYHSYGMTETTHVAAFGEVRFDKPGSSGRIISCIKAKIVDGDGKEVTQGERGEIWVQGPMVTPGYYKNLAATNETFTPDRWLRTGDLAFIDSDGYLFIVDRIKDIIKYQGYQISATELEQIIIEQKGVYEVAVIGVEHDKYGEVPKAFVVPDNKLKPSEEEIQQAVSRELSCYKWLRGGVKFVESLPKTQSMKINRKLLRTMR